MKKTYVYIALSVLLALTPLGFYFAEAPTANAAIVCNAGSIVEYPVPGNGRPWHMALGSDGNLWFTQDNNRIGRITPSGTITEFTTGANVLGNSITKGPDGNIWFTQGSEITGATGGLANPPNYNIGKITPSGVYTEYPTPAGVKPWVIAAGPDGNVWFANHHGGQIVRVTPSGVMTQFGGFAQTIGWIVTGSDGNLWVSEQNAYTIVKVSPAGTILARYPLASNSGIWSITSGPDGNLWFTTDTNKVGKITMSGVVTEYNIPSPSTGSGQGYNVDRGSTGIASGPDGNLWFAEVGANKIVMITTSGVMTEYTVPTANSRPRAMVLGSNGNMWFTETDGRKIATFSCQNAPANTGVVNRVCSDNQTTILTFNEFGQAGYRGTSPNSPKGTVVNSQYRPSGVDISATNNGEIYIASSWIYGSPTNYWAGPSGDNILGVNSNPPITNPTTNTFKFINPANGNPATVQGNTISFTIGDTEISPQPRVIIRSYDIAGNVIETRNMVSERETISFSTGNVHKVEFFDNGGDGHVLDDFRYGGLQCQATAVTCSTSTDCGTVTTTSNFCQGNAVYRNVSTPTCNNAGTAQSFCSYPTTLQLQQTCSGSQTCSNGTCGGTTCTPNSYKTCLGNTAYWYDSCGTQGSVFQVCTGGQVCQGGNCVTGTQGQSVTTNITIRNLTTGNLTYGTTVNAGPGDILQVNVAITSNASSVINNIVVTSILPANVLNANNVTVDGIANNGNIVTGINIGSINPGQTRTVTYYVQIASAQNFPFGSTTIQYPVSISSTDSNFIPSTGTATIFVTRSGVQGVTDVPTGLTNNPLIDSFFLPLMLALLGVWLYKSGFLPVPAWIGGRIAKNRNFSAEAKLQEKIAEIRNREVK